MHTDLTKPFPDVGFIALRTSLNNKRFLLAVIVCLVVGNFGYAQNMGTVFSPIVQQGASTMDLRSGYQPEGTAFAQRIQYKYGITNDWRLGGVLQLNQSDVESFGFEFIRLEAMWQFLEEETAGWASGLRIIFQAPADRNTNYRAGVAWSGLVNLDEHWQARGNLLITGYFGSDHGTGVLLGGRAQISRQVTPIISMALDYFGGNDYITSLGDFDSNIHELGPMIMINLFDSWEITGSALFGITSASPDATYRINLQCRF